MAKVGEGDPRWIVTNREDGTNVNQWHWTEKNLYKWSKKKLEEMLTDYVIYDGEGALITITTIDKMEGEIVSNNRKGKTIFIYEIELRIKWKALSRDSDGNSVETTGTFNYPELSPDFKDNEQELNIKFDASPHLERIRPLVNTKAKVQLQERVAQFLKLMREEHTVNESTPYSPKPPTEIKLASVAIPTEKKSDSASKAVKIEMTFQAAPEEIYLSLTDPGRLQAVTAGSASMEPVVGGKFSLFGSISGSNVELVPGKKIVQKWRFNDWPQDYFSIVTITLEPGKKSSGCSFKLIQTGVPANDFERTAQGWRSNILERMKMVFGFGPMVFK